MSWALEPRRLTTWSVGGQGQPYGDDVVALARSLYETTALTHKEIGARIGVSHMSICRWARSAGWLRSGPALVSLAARTCLRHRPLPGSETQRWRDLRQAERLLDILERAETADLDAMEEVLTLLTSEGCGHAPAVGQPPQCQRRRREQSSALPAAL